MSRQPFFTAAANAYVTSRTDEDDVDGDDDDDMDEGDGRGLENGRGRRTWVGRAVDFGNATLKPLTDLCFPPFRFTMSSIRKAYGVSRHDSRRRGLCRWPTRPTRLLQYFLPTKRGMERGGYVRTHVERKAGDTRQLDQSQNEPFCLEAKLQLREDRHGEFDDKPANAEEDLEEQVED